MNRKEFIKYSLELNLFFQRLIKEHLIFIEASIPDINKKEITEANILKRTFEEMLSETVIFANGAIDEEILISGEIVTPYTLKAEEITSDLSGIPINTNITKAEYNLKSDVCFEYTKWLEEKIYSINTRTLNLLEEVISFTKNLLELFQNCKIYVSLYPSLIEHTLRETKLYMEKLKRIQGRELAELTLCDKLEIWNHIMEDHSQFICGMLDPSEKELKKSVMEFAMEFEKLVERSIKCEGVEELIKESLHETLELKDFKEQSVKGILECEVSSIIFPLLADHVLREANYYIRKLNSIK